MFEVAEVYERQRGRSSKILANVFGNRADGPYTLQPKAWAVRGVGLRFPLFDQTGNSEGRLEAKGG